MTLSERVRRALDDHPLGAMKASELARATGLSKQAISLILNGTTQMLAADNAQRIAKELRVSVQWLVSGSGPMREKEIRHTVSARRGDTIEIPQMDVFGSMGPGAVPADHIETVRSVTVSLPDLKKQCSFTSVSNLQIITGLGDSMLGTINDGDPVIVDTGVKDVRIDAVYVFELDGEIFIKRLQRIPGKKIRVISDNRAAFDAYDLEPHQIERMNVHGRVVLSWNARRL